MRMRALLLAVGGLFLAAPIAASTYVEVEKTCPVGGEKFKYMELASITTFGAMPDGMPIGSGAFPIELPQCPGNGLVMYEDFDAAKVEKLAGIIARPDYQALRAAETRYYLAYRLAKELGEAESAPWLLLSATWEAKNAGGGDRARRYNEAFVALVRGLAADAKSFASIAVRARAANALRELGRFDEAEAMRAGIVIDPDAGGGDSDAAENRKGWGGYLAALARPIARHDDGRTPIDMMNKREASFRCMAKELAGDGTEVPPLTAFEAKYCERPEIAAEVNAVRKTRAR